MPEITMKTKFYHFNQNNSGGSFNIDDEAGVGPDNYIEAIDYRQANAIAEEKLFIHNYGDCSCCGQRWYPLWDNDDGFDVITVCYLDGFEGDFVWHDTIYVHRLDGEIIRVTKKFKSNDIIKMTRKK